MNDQPKAGTEGAAMGFEFADEKVVPLIADGPGKIKTWFRRTFTKPGRAERRAERLAAEVRAALNDKGSEASRHILAIANEFAQGMVARWMDDRCVLRCALCIETGNLTYSGKAKTGRKVYLCEKHGKKKA